MVRRLIALSILFACVKPLEAQNFQPDFSKWNLCLLLQAKGVSIGLLATKQEKDVIFYSNLARLNGKLFVKTILLPYLQAQGDTDLTNFYISSLISDLNVLPRLKPLRSSQLLTKMAKDYATSSGNAGIIGHENFDKRFSSLYRSGCKVGENCAYHQDNALDAVIDLLIDQYEPNLGHRHNILSPVFNRVGVGIASHRDYENVWVMEFSSL